MSNSSKEFQEIFGRIIAYEQEDLDAEETITLFQDLVNSGLVWELQGHYGRTAKRLLEGGLICGPAE